MIIDWNSAPEGATHYAPASRGLDQRWFNMDAPGLGSVWYEEKWQEIYFSSGRIDLVSRNGCVESQRNQAEDLE